MARKKLPNRGIVVRNAEGGPARGVPTEADIVEVLSIFMAQPRKTAPASVCAPSPISAAELDRMIDERILQRLNQRHNMPEPAENAAAPRSTTKVEHSFERKSTPGTALATNVDKLVFRCEEVSEKLDRLLFLLTSRVGQFASPVGVPREAQKDRMLSHIPGAYRRLQDALDTVSDKIDILTDFAETLEA